MKALYLDHIAQDYEATSARTGRAIIGRRVHSWQAQAALLRHGTYDQYFFGGTRDRQEKFRQSPLYATYKERITLVDDSDLSQLRKASHLVLWTGGPWLHKLATMRRRIGRVATPLAGIVYTVQYPSVLEDALLTMLAQLYPSDAIFCPSEAGREAILGLTRILQERLSPTDPRTLSLGIRLPLVPYGVDVSRFGETDAAGGRRNEMRLRLGIDSDAIVGLYFGRFSPISKMDLGPLLIAFSRVRNDAPKRYLVLAGDDHQLRMSPWLNELTNHIGCAEHVRIVPNPASEEKLALYATGDLFVSPSDNLQETSGLTIVEAMAAGLPVIASDWNGYRELVVPGETGLLVPTCMPSFDNDFDELRGSGVMREDDMLARTTAVSMEVLISHLNLLFQNESLRKAMGRCGQLRARRYDHQQVVAEYERIWEEQISEAKSACASSRRTAGINLLTFDYRHVFGHYPTRFASDDDWVGLTTTGRWYHEGGYSFDLLSDSMPWCTPLGLETVLEILRQQGVQTFGVLVGTLSRRAAMGDTIARAHVMRLVKYGLINLDPRHVESAVEV